MVYLPPQTFRPSDLITFEFTTQKAIHWFQGPEIPASHRGLDGAHWIFEIAAEGDYHFIDLWSPQVATISSSQKEFLHTRNILIDNDFNIWGQEFIKLSGRDFGYVY